MIIIVCTLIHFTIVPHLVYFKPWLIWKNMSYCYQNSRLRHSMQVLIFKCVKRSAECQRSNLSLRVEREGSDDTANIFSTVQCIQQTFNVHINIIFCFTEIESRLLLNILDFTKGWQNNGEHYLDKTTPHNYILKCSLQFWYLLFHSIM